jgi:putative endonuclease
LSRWRSFRSRWIRHPEAPHLALGHLGEKLAARHLKQRGRKILYRNFRGAKGGEIDLVCRHGDTLVFVEVKTRSSEDFGRPFEAVDPKKRRRIVQGAMAWLRLIDLPDLAFRFDVVEVLLPEPAEIRVIENAFGLPSNYYY